LPLIAPGSRRVSQLDTLIGGAVVLQGRGDSRCALLGMVHNRPAKEIIDRLVKQGDRYLAELSLEA
jgi:hypothetical protein